MLINSLKLPYRLKRPRIKGDLILAVAADGLKVCAFSESIINLFLRRKILRHLLTAFGAGDLQPLQPAQVSYGLYQKTDGILLIAGCKAYRP